MEVIGAIALIVLIIVLVAAAMSGANQGYTIGGGMFKNSDNNLNKDEHMDSSDYNYYDKDGKLK